MGLLTDVLVPLSSIMLPSVYARPLSPTCQKPLHHNRLLATSSNDIAAYFYRIFTLEEEKKRFFRHKKFLQFKTHFSIRQELYWRLSIVRCWQIPRIFHIRPPKTRHCFKTRGISLTRDSGWPSERGWKRTKYLFFLFFFVFSLIQIQYHQP